MLYSNGPARHLAEEVVVVGRSVTGRGEPGRSGSVQEMVDSLLWNPSLGATRVEKFFQPEFFFPIQYDNPISHGKR